VGLTDTAGEVLADARTGKNGRHRLVGLLRGHPVSDRPAAGAARASVKVRKADTTGKRRKRCALTQVEQRVSAPRHRPNRGFPRLLPARSAIYRCEGAPTGRSWPPNLSNPGNVG
jgi:hypothetical protein